MPADSRRDSIAVAITGASGALYATRTLAALLERRCHIELIVTEYGRRLLRDELGRLGAPAETVASAESETDAVRDAFAWAEPGDLLVLLSHAARARTLAFLDRLAEQQWRPGHPLPRS